MATSQREEKYLFFLLNTWTKFLVLKKSVLALERVLEYKVYVDGNLPRSNLIEFRK